MSDEYKRAVHRVATGFKLTSNLWDQSPDIQRDMVASTKLCRP